MSFDLTRAAIGEPDDEDLTVGYRLLRELAPEAQLQAQPERPSIMRALALRYGGLTEVAPGRWAAKKSAPGYWA